MGAIDTILTFEQFEALPDQPGKRELLKGEVIELPPAELRHNRISHRLFVRLYAALEAAHTQGLAREIGEAFIEMGYTLAGHSYVQPDVSVSHAGQFEEKYFGGAPAIAVEVISPSNTIEAMEIKTALYFEFGAREVWRVHRRAGYVIVLTPGESRELRGGEALTTPLLPGFSMTVGELLGE